MAKNIWESGRNTNFMRVLRMSVFGAVALLTGMVMYQQYFASRYSYSNAQSTATITSIFSPTADTYANATSPTKNYATSKSLIVKDSTLAKIVYLKFDLSSLIGKTIVSAKLRLKIVDASKDTQNYKLLNDNSWLETTLTWNNKPAAPTTAFATSANTILGSWVEVTTTSPVQQRQGQIMSVAIDATTGSDVFGFTSREGVDKPQLVIVSASDIPITPTLTPAPPTATPTLVPSPTPSSSPTPTLTLTPTSTPSPTETPTPTPTETPTPPIDILPSLPVSPTPTTDFVPAGGGGRTYYVAPTGSDTNNGDFDTPFKTVGKGLITLMPGDTLYIRGGTYVERIQNPLTQPGTAAAPINVLTYPGEKPVVQGLFWINNASYWTIDGISVTWDIATGSSNEHMVKFKGGTNWVYKNAEVWNAHSYAGLQISGGAINFRVTNLYVHDTADCRTECTGGAHSDNQDHLIYVVTASYGVLDHLLLVNSPNGRGVKLGPPSSTGGPYNVKVEYSTFYNNLGPSNLQISYDAANNEISRNIMVHPKNVTTYNITNYNVTGVNNVAHDNIGWESKGVVQADAMHLIDGGGNLFVDPQLDAAYNPQNPSVQGYGRSAP